jgi:general secretion pathway protein F/type IV pilus assembly protein PilC
MRTFYYRLLMPDGRVRSGVMRLAVERDFSARLWLEKQHQAVVLLLLRLPNWLAEMGMVLTGFMRRRLRPEELSGFLRDLAVMNRSGVPMVDALRSIIDDETKGESRAVADLANHMLDDLRSGASVSETFNRQSDIFSETVRYLVQIGDETGALDRLLLTASEHVDRINKMGQDAKRAMIYPLVTFAAIIGAGVFWMYSVIPHLAELFKQMNANVPAITKGVMAFSLWLNHYAEITLIGIVFLVLGSWILIKRSRRVRGWLYRIAHRVPIVRVLVRSSGMAFITENLSILVSSGIDIATSLSVMARSTKDEFYRSRILTVHEVVSRGESLGTAMRQVGGFPSMALRMISVGEETGSLDEQLEHLSKEYRHRLNSVIESLAEIIKPAVILLAGGLFILLVVSMLLPVYDLVKQAMNNPLM